MASTSLSDLAPDTRQKVEAFLTAAKQQGFDLRVVSTLRSCADQGLSTEAVVVQGMKLKRAPGCKSWHVWGRAVDVILDKPSVERYAELGALGEQFGLTWGGKFVSNPDPIHFQDDAGLDINKLCPDPAKCEEAIMAAGGPMPKPSHEPPTPKKTSTWLPFAAGAFLGWAVARYLRRP